MQKKIAILFAIYHIVSYCEAKGGGGGHGGGGGGHGGGSHGGGSGSACDDDDDCNPWWAILFLVLGCICVVALFGFILYMVIKACRSRSASGARRCYLCETPVANDEEFKSHR